MFGMGTGEIVVIVIVALLLFGKKLPSVAKNAGKSIRGFKDEVTKAVNGEEEEEVEEEKPKKKVAKKKATTKKKASSVKKKKS